MNKFNFDEIQFTNIPFLDLYLFMVSSPLLLEHLCFSNSCIICVARSVVGAWLYGWPEHQVEVPTAVGRLLCFFTFVKLWFGGGGPGVRL